MKKLSLLFVILGLFITTYTGCGDDGGGPVVEEYAFRTDPPIDYTRVDRQGMPAVNSALITSKDDYNNANPTDDVNGDFVGEIVASIDALHADLDDDLANAGLTPCTGGADGSCVAQGGPLIIPDAIAIDTTAPAGFPNGRRLEDPVIDVTLAVILVDLAAHAVTVLADLPLNPPENDVPFQAAFPYMAEPH